jgi:hypothetical protein
MTTTNVLHSYLGMNLAVEVCKTLDSLVDCCCRHHSLILTVSQLNPSGHFLHSLLTATISFYTVVR